MNSPLFYLLMTAAGLYVAKLWNDDRRKPHERALPGAAATTPKAIWTAIIGALVLLGAETYGENALGIADQQSKITWLFALYSIVGAPIIEEMVFRGYLVVTGKGRTILWTAAVGVSLVFAVGHQYLWHWENSTVVFTLTTKGWFSTGVLFATSLWLYIARFAAWNPTQSLLPSFAGHAAKNAGVVVIKAATGYMSGLW